VSDFEKIRADLRRLFKNAPLPDLVIWDGVEFRPMRCADCGNTRLCMVDVGVCGRCIEAKERA
jgi:hypothetical protein